MNIISKARFTFLLFFFSIFLLPLWGITGQVIALSKTVYSIISLSISTYLIILMFIAFRCIDKCSIYIQTQVNTLSNSELENLLKKARLSFNITSEFVVVRFIYREETFFFSKPEDTANIDGR